MLPPFDISDDVTVVYTSAHNAIQAPELRTRIKVLEGGGVEVTYPGSTPWDRLIVQPGAEVVIDMQMSAPASAYVTYALHRIVKAKE